MVLQVSLESKNLYLLNRLGEETYDGDIARAFKKCLLVISGILWRARDSGLWYRGWGLELDDYKSRSTIREVSVAPLSLPDEDAFELTPYNPEEPADSQEPPEPQGIPIFPLAEGEVVTWNQIVRLSAESVLPPQREYEDLGPYRITLIGSDESMVKDLSSRYFGEDTGDPLKDFTNTSVTITTGVREMESKGKFFFEEIDSGETEDVVFFKR